MADVTIVARLSDPVAVHTVFHVVDNFGGKDVALRNRAVALRTRNPGIRMGAVAKKNEIGQAVEAHPRNFFFPLERRELPDKRAFPFDDIVACHALDC